MNCHFKLHCHDQPVEIATENESLSFADYLVEKCPSLGASYSPTPYLFSGHLQTGYAWLFKDQSPYVMFERELVIMKDGGQISLDWTISEKHTMEDITTPVLVVLHGLTGGSHESYIHGVLEKIIQGPQSYRGVVMHARGCGQTEITTPQTFNAAWTEDLRETLLYIQNKLAPGTPIVGIGFSLGANILVKYLGEEKENTPLKAAISVANPFDFMTCNIHIDGTFLRRILYSRTMAKNLGRVFGRHLTMMKKHPDIIPDKVMSATTVRAYDYECTRKVFGYSTVNNYYRDASSARFIEHVRIPLVCINALDDPISLPECIPWEEIKINPYVVMATTDYGGHLGWFQNILYPTRWIDQKIADIVGALFKVRNYQLS